MRRPNKIIHQTWKREEIPAEYQLYVDSIKQYNPDYEYRLWTDAQNRQLIVSCFPWFLSTYDSYNHPIERADAIRYFILYKYGGVYIDLDMQALQPIGPLFEDAECFFSVEAGPAIENKVVSNAFMAAPENHKLFETLIHHLAEVKGRDITFQDVFENTGPNMLHSFLSKSLGQYSIKIIDLNDVCPRGVLTQLDNYSGMTVEQIIAKQNHVLIHHNTESWNVQHPLPERSISGYTLLEDQDIHGYDLEYVAGDLSDLIRASNSNPVAIGFNFNGYLKGNGGSLGPMSRSSSWLKENRSAWVCIKNKHLEELKCKS